jgi:hypothetical protein
MMVVELRAPPTVLIDGATKMASPLCDATTSAGREFTFPPFVALAAKQVEYAHRNQ